MRTGHRSAAAAAPTEWEAAGGPPVPSAPCPTSRGSDTPSSPIPELCSRPSLRVGASLQPLEVTVMPHATHSLPNTLTTGLQKVKSSN